ncbi:WhiB family transcriptional regulator [Actinomadura sp. HBU206391]|uniref:WhiB family transcriptional regulator n=1 Tax=Actinomadura sp. HBU206391 TaxID=2731692 RepID=UPI001650BAF3|nr:WhiB family transcriptional regulator [Actinomadura sp. HBU206391]MBC6463563.1 WhiB family transcriptional regulator [Actinomadura sp. HBU206391]
MAESECRTEDPELFFPIGLGDAVLGQIEQAVSICHRCSVKAQCLNYALINGIKHGIWGGLTEQRRITLENWRPHRSARDETAEPHPAA